MLGGFQWWGRPAVCRNPVQFAQFFNVIEHRSWSADVKARKRGNKAAITVKSKVRLSYAYLVFIGLLNTI